MLLNIADMYDPVRRRIANASWLSLIFEPGETDKWSVTAICSTPDAQNVHEGYLTMTDRRLIFYSDSADSLGPPSLVLRYADVKNIDSHRLPSGTALSIVTMADGEMWHIVTGRKSTKRMKKLVRRSL